MNCLDCATTHIDRAAVGTCIDCGAAVCADHAVVRSRHLTRTAVINRQVPVEPAARVFRCRICDAARVAQHDGRLGAIYEPVTARGASPARVA
jgi:hypothetical protein